MKNTDNEILLVGHTDSTGSGEINFNISILRAETVKDYLINQGIETDRIKIDGEGETSPKYSNETSEGRRLNRRVQLIIQN